MSTDDPNNPRIRLNIEGMVEKFATISPNYVRLRGRSTDEIISKVTIIKEEKYPFFITEAKAKDSKNIHVELGEIKGEGKKGYILTIKNIKIDGGRYHDTIVLKTTSKIRPEITIGVSGYITAPQIAVISPRSVYLKGELGEQLKSVVTITPLEKYPFEVIGIKAKDGKNIHVELEEIKEEGKRGYNLTVNNIKEDAGQYQDAIILQTTSKIQPEIIISVNSHIKAPQIAVISPRAVYMRGKVGEPLKAVVTIEPLEKYPFKIIEVKSDSEKYLRFDLKEVVESEKTKYLLTIENQKEEEGLYQDTIRLKTSSNIQDEIQISVSVRIGDPQDFNFLDIMKKGASKKGRLPNDSFIKGFQTQ